MNWSKPEAIRKLLALPKPSAVFDERWNELKEDLGTSYRTATVTYVLERQVLFGIGLKELQHMFDTVQATDELNQTEQNKIRKWLQVLYSAILVEQIEHSRAPVETINSADLNLLSNADALKAFAYQRQMKDLENVCTPWDADQFLRRGRPAFMSDRDYDRLTNLAKAIKKADEDSRRYSVMISSIRNILKGAGLGSNPPPEILPDEWTNLKRIEQDMAQQAETAALKARVLRQLEVINVFLNDPSVIDRIEDYEAVFAPGNLLSLRRLAQQLRNSPKG